MVRLLLTMVNENDSPRPVNRWLRPWKTMQNFAVRMTVTANCLLFLHSVLSHTHDVLSCNVRISLCAIACCDSEIPHSTAPSIWHETMRARVTHTSREQLFGDASNGNAFSWEPIIPANGTENHFFPHECLAQRKFHYKNSFLFFDCLSVCRLCWGHSVLNWWISFGNWHCSSKLCEEEIVFEWISGDSALGEHIFSRQNGQVSVLCVGEQCALFAAVSDAGDNVNLSTTWRQRSENWIQLEPYERIRKLIVLY